MKVKANPAEGLKTEESEGIRKFNNNMKLKYLVMVND